MKGILLILILPVGLIAYGQKTPVKGEAPTTVFRSTDTTENFYVVLEPTTPPKALLVILPGFGGLPVPLLGETDLPFKARNAGYLVVIPYLAANSMSYDSISQSRLTSLIPEVIRRYKVPGDKFIIGGHSAGGNAALLYAEHAMKANNSGIVKPQATFGVDPPLDMKRLWRLFEYLLKIKYSEVSVNEASYILDLLRKDLGGSPYERPAQFELASSFYRDADGGKIKHLATIPVRLYCDPDVNWYIEQRRMPLELTNASDLSASIIQLKLLGNSRAELVTNLGKGYFSNGMRHPHAFSQLDADEFLIWANKCLE